ncbi:hypothetical protein KKF91_15160 [Myxococcota bacterium]|nr:hypothetical protein [Myxococcota bacterium]MBU1431879.1 hypothetical protein [Myxococcota bacterium]MBU1899501.1 hypothetical protein [Myxococcota bacterium]
MTNPELTLSDILKGHIPLTHNRALVADLIEHRDNPFLALMFSPNTPLERGFFAPLLSVMRGLEAGEVLDLFLGFLGPPSEEAWRLISLLRRRFKQINAIIPYAASGAVSQVALGADHLLMSGVSSLSPIEAPPDEGLGPMDLMSIFRWIKQAGVSSPEAHARIWAGVDPVALARQTRALDRVKAVTRRCLETHVVEPERLEEILSVFSCGLLGDRFPLTQGDCLAAGLSVKEPSDEAWGLITKLQKYYDRMLALEGDLLLSDKHYTLSYDAFIDTLNARRVLIRITRVNEHGRPLPDTAPIQRWVRPSAREVEVDKELDLSLSGVL